MQKIMSRSLLATLVLAASLVSRQAEDGQKKDGCPAVAAKADCKLLKGSGARLVVPVHHSGQVETIKKYVAQLPEGVQSAYHLDGKLVVALQ